MLIKNNRFVIQSNLNGLLQSLVGGVFFIFLLVGYARAAILPTSNFIQIDPQYPHSFRYESGERYFPMGDTAYELLERDMGTIISYLNSRAAAGFNFIRIVAYNQGGLSKLDDVFTAAADRGINIELILWGYGDSPSGGGVDMWGDTDAENNWAAEVAARYRDKDNLFMYTVANEFERYKNPNVDAQEEDYEYRESDVEWAKRIAQVIHDNDQNHHVGVHPSAWTQYYDRGYRYQGFTTRAPQVVWPLWESGPVDLYIQQNNSGAHINHGGGALTYDTYEDWEGERYPVSYGSEGWDFPYGAAGLDNSVAEDWEHGKPALNTEFGYQYESGCEGTSLCNSRQGHTPDSTRMKAWQIATAGGYFAAGFSSTWRGGEDSGNWRPEYLTILYNFFTTRTEYWKMAPHLDLTESRNVLLALPGVEYVAYFPRGGTNSIDLEAGTYSQAWFNPRTDDYAPSGTVNGGGQRSFTPPSETSEDWVLHLKSTSGGGCIPSTEICDGKDNDCDKQVDEGNVCNISAPLCAAADGCLAYWKLDEVSGTTAADSSGNGHSGELQSGPVWAQGRIGGGIRLSGDDMVYVPGLLGQPQTVTIAAWVNLEQYDGTTSGGAGPVVVSIGSSVDLLANFTEQDGDPVRGPAGSFYSGNFGWILTRVNGPVEGTGWHHYAFVNEPNGPRRLYIDGILRAEDNSHNMPDIAYNVEGTRDYTRLECVHANGRVSSGLSCLVDDVRVYGRVLSATEIAALAGGGGGGIFCGDGTCNGSETCSTCSGDCGPCGSVCGDGTCNGNETCSSCPQDCGTCNNPYCGDGSCNNGETCSNCSEDCGTCSQPACSDGVDNDGDGKMDYPNDPGCGNAQDNDETDIVNGTERNLSRLSAISQSSPCYPGECWDNLIDGDINDAGASVWDGTVTANKSGGAFAVIDLPGNELYTLSKVRLLTDTGVGHDSRWIKDFRVEVSQNGSSFAKVIDNTKTNGGFEEYVFPSGSKGSHVKLIFDSNGGDGTWYQVGELEVWGAVAGNPVCGNTICEGGENAQSCPQDCGSGACLDGIDNDSDGKRDYPADPGCRDVNDNDERDCNVLTTTGKSETFEAQSFDVDGQNLTYIFNWGDGTETRIQGVAQGITQRPAHVWANPGDYSASVKVEDMAGAQSEISDAIQVCVSVPGG